MTQCTTTYQQTQIIINLTILNMRAIIRTMGFVYVYSNLAIVFPFMLLRYIALHEWTTQLVWLPWFDAVLPPANHRELTFVENDKIAIIYLGVSVLNAFNQTLNFFCDRDGNIKVFVMCIKF